MIAPQKIKSRLAPTPGQAPRYASQILNLRGETVLVPDPQATRAMVALMNAQAIFGGAAAHWGGPSALAELMAAVHALMFGSKDQVWHENYNFVNDVGHCENGIYAVRSNYGFDGLTLESLKGFRSFESKLTGHGESHLNPEGVLLSNGPLGSAVAQAQGLAMGDKLQGKERVTLLALSDGAAMEGETREALAAIPGMAAKGLLNPFVLVLSDNKTKLSGRIEADSYSMQPTFAGLATLGWNVIELADGHDLTAVYQTLEKALADAKLDPTRPVCVWAQTIKGKGLAKTEAAASGGHGFPNDLAENVTAVLNEVYGEVPVPAEFLAWGQEIEAQFAAKKAKAAAAAPAAVKKEKIQAGVARALCRLAKEGLPVVSVASDLQGSTGMAPFQKEFPGQSWDVGIAEANMVSVAAGLSKQGYVPVVDTFAQFGVTKGLLPLTMAAISQAPIIAVFSHVGFQDAADGASHQATTYLAALASVPYVRTVVLSCSSEAEALVEEAVRYQIAEKEAGRTPDSVIFFLGREDFPVNYGFTAHRLDQASVLRQGRDGVVVASGHMVVQALAAADELATQGLEVTVVQNAVSNRPDLETIRHQLSLNSGRLVTIEDHQVVGGMGATLTHALMLSDTHFKVRSLGIRGHFGHSAYKASELYDAHGLGVQDIVQAIKSLA